MSSASLLSWICIHTPLYISWASILKNNADTHHGLDSLRISQICDFGMFSTVSYEDTA